ncbi:hypothetical protein ACIA5C_12790 [Actinoplanes sp. NPDC051343]|uniref:hypothetical protein n=1 Tax=Actinoplanes sp. NPDC051343 TaxID=3363906 RepID=UPI00378991B3
MTQHADQLREAFESHEKNTPDPGAVYARVQELSRKYKRRRRGAQVAGGAVLGAGLIAAGINLPAFLPGNAHSNTGPTGINAAGLPNDVPSVAASYSDADQQKDWDAYFNAGYGYNDAVQLATLWHSKANIGNVKSEAGRRLLAGETLPIKPTGNPDTPPPSQDDPQVKADQAALDAFFNAGYVWDDAVKLAKAWHLSDPSDAKVVAGKKIEAHQALPFKPKPANVKAAKEQAAELKFWDAGYTQADAVKLGKIWHVSTYQAKVEGGQKLLAGESLPIKP